MKYDSKGKGKGGLMLENRDLEEVIFIISILKSQIHKSTSSSFSVIAPQTSKCDLNDF